MYLCTDCKKKFFDPKITLETEKCDSPPYERLLLCPFCLSERIIYVKPRHCKCCGARLPMGFTGDYCGKMCEKRGKKMWTAEAERKLKRLSDPITVIMKSLLEYNKEHKTNLSYGQYVALVLPKNEHRKKAKLS